MKYSSACLTIRLMMALPAWLIFIQSGNVIEGHLFFASSSLGFLPHYAPEEHQECAGFEPGQLYPFCQSVFVWTMLCHANQHCWLTSATSIIFLHKKIGNAGYRTLGPEANVLASVLAWSLMKQALFGLSWPTHRAELGRRWRPEGCGPSEPLPGTSPNPWKCFPSGPF